MATIEGVVCVYGIPNLNHEIITKDAAINAVEKAKAEGKIQDYRVEGNERTGKIIATVQV